MWVFLGGVLVGANLGLLLGGILAAAGSADEAMDHLERHYEEMAG